MRKPPFSEEDPWSRVKSSISPHVRWCQREFPSTWINPSRLNYLSGVKLLSNLSDQFTAKILLSTMDKTNFSIFHQRRKRKLTYYNSLTVGQMIIIESSVLSKWVYYWMISWHGITIYTLLISRTITSILYAFRPTKKLECEKYKKQLYFAYCYSTISWSYGLKVYGTTSKLRLQNIHLQNNI